MLKITTDLTKAALSMRLMGDKSESPESKLHDCIWNVWQIWKATTPVKGTQLIFCDFSTPKSDRYNVYYYLRDCLMQLGIPSQQIAFIHDHDKTKRGPLFEKVNKGEVRILLGSTGKLGTGCNVHKNGLYAMHHVDAPWRPADIEQREGRGIRQGNGEGLDGSGKILKSVLVFRYITERLDALRWQTLQWKQEMIKKFMNGHDVSSVEDCDQAVYSYAQVKSLATGNPLLIEDTNLRNELQSLLIQQRSHNERQSGMKFDATRWSSRIGALVNTIESVEKDVSCLQNRDKSKFEATFVLDTGDVLIDDPIKAGELFTGDCNALLKDKVYTPRLVCKYASFDVLAWPQMTNQVLIILKRDNRYDLPLKFSNKSYTVSWYKPETVFKTIDAVLNSLGDYLESLRSQLETARIEQLRCESLVGQSFPQSARIVEIQSRLAEIDAIMAEEEAALGVKAADDDDSDDASDDSEDSGDFWNKDDLSIGYSLPEQSIIDMLKARSRSVDWLSELKQMVESR